VFTDYYALFSISRQSTQDEIKKAFKSKALEWHPDRNQSANAEKMMQLINEAYLILKDEQAKLKYDNEYELFVNSQIKQKTDDQGSTEEVHESYSYQEYNVKDEELKRWIKNAKEQAISLAKQSIEDFKGIALTGASAALGGAVSAIGSYIGISILFTILFALTRGCQG
jgi:curved DNA-binding protein CbpA